MRKTAPAVIVATLAAIILQACATVAGPFQAAETLPQQAYAIERAYNILLEAAAAVVEDPTTAPEIRTNIAAAEATSTPVIDALDEAVVAYIIAKAELAAGETTEDKLNIAAANLAAWVTDAERAMLALSNAIDGD